MSRKLIVELAGTDADVTVYNTALSLFRLDRDVLVLHSVTRGDHVPSSELSRFESVYVGILSHSNVVLEIEPQGIEPAIADVILRATRRHMPDAIIMGVGKDASPGRLGTVVNSMINLSSHNVLVVKSAACAKRRPKRYVFCADGSQVTLPSVEKLTPLLDASDEVFIVTVSFHHGSKDKDILNSVATAFSKVPLAKIETQFVGRDASMTLGEQIVRYAAEVEADVLACATGRHSVNRLGSTSSYALMHGATNVLVLKVPTTEPIVPRHSSNPGS